MAGSTEGHLRFPKSFGYMPIMVQSKKCHLRLKSRVQLIRMGEEPDEFGGIFICNGIERIIRLLIQQRRHYIMALSRPAYRNRGPNYTPYATMLRCAIPLSKRDVCGCILGGM
jgi:DNA-directed RNA polymerase I subunit RPA2